MAESKELKSLLMKVKEESEEVDGVSASTVLSPSVEMSSQGEY